MIHKDNIYNPAFNDNSTKTYNYRHKTKNKQKIVHFDCNSNFIKIWNLHTHQAILNRLFS